jgi:heme/copper-type cytochrome/quinol oxidase subunit 2
MPVVTSLLAEVEAHVELPFPAIVFGLIALVVFAALAAVMWSYRNVSNRHPRKSAAYSATHDPHGHADRTGADH